MRITTEAKKLLAEFLSRSGQIIFAMVLVGPFVTGNVKIETAVLGIVGITASLLFALAIASTIEKEE